MNKIKAVPLLFFALLFATLYFPAQLAATDKLRISYSAVNATQAFLWVAQDKGIFAKHGLEGELLYINSGTMNIAALVGGSVQIAGGGPVSIEARLRGVKLTILGNPLPWLASNLVVHPDIKSIPDLAGKFAGISRFGSSTDQGFRYLFRKNGLNVDKDLKMLQMGGDSSRVGALKAGTVQYTFLGAAATDNARALGFRVLATAQQMAIPFPWTSVVVEESWLNKNRDLAYRYMKCATEAIVTLKRNRADSQRIISKYMKINDPKLAATEFEFVSSLMPDYMSPTIEGTKLILENFGKEYPDAPRRDPKEFVDSSIMERLKQEKFVEGLKF
ncbi:MAG TPA: ABC transporter substrate-binding protein [Terriglobales bacterium]|jgi:ABC-type nitrate/sulfonate/bicarbonate transport system substrate-binding protein|nr:ABC transporter substrate-binding protein [Terriglobales bacterium]